MADRSTASSAELPIQPAPELCWKASNVTEDKLAELEKLGLIRSKAALGWHAPVGHRIPYEDKTEVVVFTSFFECGFGIPTADFFRGLLEYYGIEVTHLNPNSILDIAVFIHLCEAFLGIPPHFDLWRRLYRLKPIKEGSGGRGLPKVVGGAGFAQWTGAKKFYFDLFLKDSNKGWAKGRFYIGNHAPGLPPRSGFALVEWDSWKDEPSPQELLVANELLQHIDELKQRG